MSAEAPPSGSLVRWVLPIGLFVVIVGAIAWVSQNLPKGAIQKSTAPVIVDGANKPADLHFLRTRAIWDADDPNYTKECETGIVGHYDFPFVNKSQTPVTLGFSKTDCDCSHLRVVVLDKEQANSIEERNKQNPTEFPIDPSWKWTTLEPTDKAGIQVPAEGGGVARIEWDGRKGSGPLKLSISVWMQPSGKTGERSFAVLDVPVVMAPAVRFSSDKLALGVIGAEGQVRGELLAWSPTRDDLELKADPAKVDALFDVAFEKLDAKGAAALQDKLFEASVVYLDPKLAAERLANLRETARATRYRSAYRITVTLREQKGDMQLDQGPMSRELPIVAEAVPTELHKPTVTAYVRGGVDVGSVEDAGKIHLSFRASDGVKKTIPLWSEAGNELTLDFKYPSVLNVNLKRIEKESTKARTKWSLEIAVPPGAWSGPFLEDSVIYIRTSTPPRRIRIPVTGNAGQG